MLRRSLPLLLAFLIAPSLFAAIAELATFDEKVENAAAIVLGKCVRSDARWDAEKRWILTYSTFQVEKVLKGNPAVNELVVITPGGAVSGIHQETLGVPAFKIGDEKVLFIRNTRVGPTVLYFDQGAYDVSIGGHGERLIAPMATSAVKIDAQRGVAVSESEPVRTLPQFERDVQTTIMEIGKRNKLKMEALEAKRRQQASLATTAKRNRWIITIAILGLMLASIPLMRRG